MGEIDSINSKQVATVVSGHWTIWQNFTTTCSRVNLRQKNNQFLLFLCFLEGHALDWVIRIPCVLVLSAKADFVFRIAKAELPLSVPSLQKMESSQLSVFFSLLYTSVNTVFCDILQNVLYLPQVFSRQFHFHLPLLSPFQDKILF